MANQRGSPFNWKAWQAPSLLYRRRTFVATRQNFVTKATRGRLGSSLNDTIIHCRTPKTPLWQKNLQAHISYTSRVIVNFMSK